AALAQLRALLCLAQRLLAHNRSGCLFPLEEDGLSEQVLREYSTMHNGCFYGRCLGFQVTGTRGGGGAGVARRLRPGVWVWGTRGRGDR
ncbi:LIPS lipase, partial [Mesembrinibis cayennensis]|nr:LIPS lipase [Mesembrinibis cayennensis]